MEELGEEEDSGILDTTAVGDKTNHSWPTQEISTKLRTHQERW